MSTSNNNVGLSQDEESLLAYSYIHTVLLANAFVINPSSFVQVGTGTRVSTETGS